MGVAADLLQLLQLLANTPNGLAAAPQAAAAAGAAAGALRAFTTADDDRPPASKAFMHARLLAGKPHNALQVLLPVLQQLQQGPERPVGPLMSVLAAVRQVRGGNRAQTLGNTALPGLWGCGAEDAAASESSAGQSLSGLNLASVTSWGSELVRFIS